MKKTKYYTPKIEEFHAGFKFERHYQKGKYNFENVKAIADGGDGLPEFIPEEPKAVWHKDEIPFDKDSSYWNYPLVTIIELIVKNKVRVKYLDNDDFTSLGWHNYGKAPKGILYRGYSDERFNKVRIIHLPQSNHVLIYTIDVDLHDQTGFAGCIQNISELKVIIKQLKIKPE